MLRPTFVVAILLTLSAGTGRAETLPLVTPPDGYTYDGTPVSFAISAPGLSAFTGYTLQFTVTAGPAGFTPDLTVSAAPPPNLALYPFSDTSHFNATAVPVAGTNSYSVTITDFTTGPGVDTFLGVNDQLALAAIRPGVTLTGPITVRFTGAEFATTPGISPDLPPAFTIPQLPDQPPLVPVPSPPAWALFGIGGLLCLLRARGARLTPQ